MILMELHCKNMTLQKQILMQADENSIDEMEKLKYIFKHI